MQTDLPTRCTAKLRASWRRSALVLVCVSTLLTLIGHNSATAGWHTLSIAPSRVPSHYRSGHVPHVLQLQQQVRQATSRLGLVGTTLMKVFRRTDVEAEGNDKPRNRRISLSSSSSPSTRAGTGRADTPEIRPEWQSKTSALQEDLSQLLGQYVVTLRGCAERGEWEEALDMFKEMKQVGIEPDADAFQALVLALTKGKQIKRAMRVLAAMKDRGIPLNVRVVKTSSSAGISRTSELVV